MKLELPKVSIVVIGHNESKNLDGCFTAIKSLNYPKDKIEIIYIDSKSNDNSIEIAKKYTSNIYHENSYWPTAGEAFNRGIVQSTADFVHITGGDIQLHPDYLSIAITTLLERDDIQCATGYFVEKEMKGWNKILAYRREENKVFFDHFISSPNGGTFKKEALIKVNGYDERIKKGQESELGKRFSESGFKIWYMHIPQGTHDFDLSSVTDMALRSYGDGYSLGYMLFLAFKEKSNQFLQAFKKIAIKHLIFNTALLLLLVIMIFFGGFVYIFIWILFYLLIYLIRVAIKQRKKTWKHKLYFLMIGYFSIFSFFGILKFIIYYLKLKLKGIQIVKTRIGLKLDIKESLINEKLNESIVNSEY